MLDRHRECNRSQHLSDIRQPLNLAPQRRSLFPPAYGLLRPMTMLPVGLTDALKPLSGMGAGAGTAVDAAAPVGHCRRSTGCSLTRFLAPQRGAALAALSAFRQSGTYSLLLVFPTNPDTPRDNRLTTVADINVLDDDSLGAAGP